MTLKRADLISKVKAQMDRRDFIIGAAALLVSKPSFAQDSPAIIRPVLDGVNPRFSELALDGPYPYPNAATIFNGADARYFFFVPKYVTKARLIVFSHGALADPTSYRKLLFHWASHGYIVAAPLHDDAILESGPTLRLVKAGAVSQWPVSSLLEDPIAWKNRVDRCVECVDIAKEIALTRGIELEADRIIIAGHGYGAYITQLLMGAEVNDAEGRRLTFRDDRFFAGMCMSPQGPGIMGLTETSWENVTSPMLYLLAKNDDDFTGQDFDKKGESYRLAAPGYKHLVVFKDAGSTLFTQGLDTPPRGGLTPFLGVKAMTVCFSRAYGDYDPVSFSNLSDNFFERNSKNTLMEHRR